MTRIIICFVLYLCVLVKGEDVCDNPVVDALSKAKVKTSEDILIYKEDKFYRYNIEERLMVGEPMKIHEYWPEVEIPITGAEFFYGNNTSYMFIASKTRLWRCKFENIDLEAEFLEEKLNKEIHCFEGNTESVGATEFHTILYAEENTFHTCTANEMMACKIESSEGGEFSVPFCRDLDRHFKTCSGATGVLIGDNLEEVVADGKTLVIGDLESGERKETIDTASEVFGCRSWLLLVISGVAGITLMSILVAAAVFVVIQRREKQREAEIGQGSSTHVTQAASKIK